jgi:hypothetical protein
MSGIFIMPICDDHTAINYGHPTMNKVRQGLVIQPSYVPEKLALIKKWYSHQKKGVSVKERSQPKELTAKIRGHKLCSSAIGNGALKQKGVKQGLRWKPSNMAWCKKKQPPAMKNADCKEGKELKPCHKLIKNRVAGVGTKFEMRFCVRVAVMTDSVRSTTANVRLALRDHRGTDELQRVTVTETRHIAVFYNAHMHCTVLHCTILYCIVLHSTVLLLLTDEHACSMSLHTRHPQRNTEYKLPWILTESQTNTNLETMVQRTSQSVFSNNI